MQRVSSAEVRVADELVASVGGGALIYAAVERGDDEAVVSRMAVRILNWPLFADERDRIARSLRQTGGEILLVPQFTLAAVGHKGQRPDFSAAAPAQRAKKLFQHLLGEMSQAADNAVCSGIFGADMRVRSCNEGPVAFLLQQSA